MIRKPPADWQRGESTAVEAVKAAVNAAHAGARVARRGGHVARGLLCFFFAILWGFGALLGGLLAGSVATFFGVGAMAAFMAWAGIRAFAKARAASG